MTMDFGYLLSTLCGTVLGSLAVRKYGVENVSRTIKLFVLAVAVMIIAGDLY
jgi:hypothetical protein